MNKFNWYYYQLVTEGHMDTAFDNVEQAIRDLANDVNIYGIVDGLVASAGSGAKEVDLTAGTAYDSSGRRVRLPSNETVTLDTDIDGLAITNPGGGNEKWVGVFIRFFLDANTVEVDGTGTEVLFNLDESYEIVVRQAVEAASGTNLYASASSGEIRITDVRIDPATATFSAGNFSNVNRDYAFIADDGTTKLVDTNLNSLLGQVLSTFTGSAGASGVGFDNAGVPAVFTDVAAADNVQEAIDGIVDGLANTTSGGQGGLKVGYSPTALWANSGTRTNNSVTGGLEEIVTDLAERGVAGGSERIGIRNTTSFTNTTLHAAISTLDTDWGKLDRASTWSALQTYSAGISVTGTGLDISSGGIDVTAGGITVTNGNISADGVQIQQYATGEDALVTFRRAQGNVGASVTNGVVVVNLAASSLPLGSSENLVVEGTIHARSVSNPLNCQVDMFIASVRRNNPLPSGPATVDIAYDFVKIGSGTATHLTHNASPSATVDPLVYNLAASGSSVQLRVASTGVGDDIDFMVRWTRTVSQ